MAKKKNATKKGKVEPKSQSEDKSQVEVVTPDNVEEDNEGRSLILAGIIVVLLLAGIGFLVYGLVQSINTNGDDGDTDVVVIDDEDEENDDTNENGEGDETSEDDGADDNGDSEGDNQEDSEETSDEEGRVDDENSETNGEDVLGARTEKYPVTSTVYRRGNDYQFGDITGSTYTIREGDTLWQIAEARYGSGYAWVDINEANNHFPLLKTGEPVLLLVGDEIVLPQL